MRQRVRLGMALFLLNEAVLFFMLVGAFVYFRSSTRAAAAANLHLQSASLFTALLLGSSLTMWRAVATEAPAWLGGTLALGAAFLYGQGREYWRLFQEHITISRDQFGTTFFALTGVHALHVLVGLTLIGILAGEVGSKVGRRTALDAVALYWYFVDAVWVAIFAIVYLWPLL